MKVYLTPSLITVNLNGEDVMMASSIVVGYDNYMSDSLNPTDIAKIGGAR